MKNITIAVLLFISFPVLGQQYGAGLRVGDPTGLTFRMYLEKIALEGNIGRGNLFQGKNWHEKRFDVWHSDQDFDHRENQFIQHNTTFPFSIQLHLIHPKTPRRIFGKPLRHTSWYYGYGIHFCVQQYDYQYRFRRPGSFDWEITNGELTDINLGPDALVGIKYTFPKAPFTLFADINLFMEVYDDPFRFRFSGGFGFRYLFGSKPDEEVTE